MNLLSTSFHSDERLLLFCNRTSTLDNRIRVKLASKSSAILQALNLVDELQRFGRVSDYGVDQLRRRRDRLAPAFASIPADTCPRLLAFDRQVQTVRRLLHSAAWAVNDDFRLLRRVVEVERRLHESLFHAPELSTNPNVPELIEILLLAESLMQRQMAALRNYTG